MQAITWTPQNRHRRHLEPVQCRIGVAKLKVNRSGWMGSAGCEDGLLLFRKGKEDLRIRMG